MKNDRKRNRRIKLSAAALSLVLLLSCAACGFAAESPSAKIVEPAAATAGDVTISVDVAGFNTGERNAAQGYIVYYMDTSVPVYYAHSALSKAGTYAVSKETSYTWTGVTPGEHKFSVQLVDDDHSPLPAPVVDSTTILVGAPDGAPQLEILNLTDGDSLPPGNILLVAGVNNFIVSRKDMGVVNRSGEGHLIYYIDEDPPTEQGAPAVTDTSMVSTDLSRLWKGITEGSHTFSVQLVNNDDTPLETPVFVTVTIDVKP
ncbi:MAG: hypothetical protein GX417_10110 [Clostridiales bacterium]|nr:hypothetical protein [Clostridiales bacterium]